MKTKYTTLILILFSSICYSQTKMFINKYNGTSDSLWISQIKSITFKMSAGVVPTNGLIAYYPFNGNANDESGNGNNGTVSGCTYVAGRIGTCLNLATGDHVDVPNAPSLNPAQVTLAMWVNFDTIVTSGNQFLASKGDDRTQGSYYLSQHGEQQFHFYLGANGVDQVYAASQTLSLKKKCWYHVAGTYDGTTVKIYVDGVLSGTTPAQITIGNTQSLSIGYHNMSGWEYFLTGRLDELRIYNRALTDSEIQQLYNESGQ